MAEKAFKVPSLELVGGTHTLTANSASLIWGGDLLATDAYVNSAIADLVNSAPATLDTLNELAAALGDDANFATTITNSIAAKQDALTEGPYIITASNIIRVDKENLVNDIAGHGLTHNTFNDKLDFNPSDVTGLGLYGSMGLLWVNTDVIATTSYVDAAILGVNVNVQALAGDYLTYNAAIDALDVNKNGLLESAVGNGTYVTYSSQSGLLSIDTAGLFNSITGYGLQYDSQTVQLSVNTSVIATQAYVDSAIAGVDINVEALAGDGLAYNSGLDTLELDKFGTSVKKDSSDSAQVSSFVGYVQTSDNTYGLVAAIPVLPGYNPSFEATVTILGQSNNTRVSRIVGSYNGNTNSVEYTEYAIVENGTVMPNADVLVEVSGVTGEINIRAKGDAPATNTVKISADVKYTIMN